MHSQVYIIKPSIDYQDAYISFYQDWINSGENIVPWVVGKDPTDFPAMLQFLSEEAKEELLPEGWVPASTYWLMDTANKVVGAVNIRHRLNEKLLNSGGHIGYGICPSERRKGYATLLLSLALQQTAELGLQKVLVVCDKGNIGSERTILKNGGVFESEFIEENGNCIRRFWIDVKERIRP
ncbi:MULTISPECIES: GNAT family N-acetyltransferase [unclassified Paenibacillus]|uniref:GNAT family N-acetyltransferase n=1 Tax=unclassified Paenibacillus TaxID=185978 RepID=UPI0036283AB1